ncbi:permease [Sneathiella limimaris]|uniref:permease n=1 Tax=Sneathiella limimaris TaxID=1964213 RepID=UPI00146E293B|nr:permease [Sneathiella limimaris]
MSEVISPVPENNSCCGPANSSAKTSFQKINQILSALGTPIFGILAILIILAVSVPEDFQSHLTFISSNLLSIAPFLLLSVGIAAYLKATGADQIVSSVFRGNPVKSILVASLFGALSPFCSCGVIPLVAALLASGVPFAPVLAFCISSPIMDPEMFILTAAELGTDFALVKTAAAIGIGLLTGLVTLLIGKTGFLENGLKDIARPKCGAAPIEKPSIHWAFWKQSGLTQKFGTESKNSLWFLGKWLTFAFVLESLMVSYVPAETITSLLGAENSLSLLYAAIIGVPAYLNGYAAIPLVDGLLELGMSPATGLTFMLAGSATSIPAAVGIWSLLKPKLFSLYVGFAFVGALLGGWIYSLAL